MYKYHDPESTPELGLWLGIKETNSPENHVRFTNVTIFVCTATSKPEVDGDDQLLVDTRYSVVLQFGLFPVKVPTKLHLPAP